MGGRGASLGEYYYKGKNWKYGEEYETILEHRNIKFVKYKHGSTATPMETMSKDRVYVTINNQNEIKAVTFYDNENKRVRQIDVSGTLHKINGVPTLPHTHKGYEHDENGTRKITKKEARILKKIKKV